MSTTAKKPNLKLSEKEMEVLAAGARIAYGASIASTTSGILSSHAPSRKKAKK